ncbi:MAG: glycosyltransferase family 4 protein [Bryobacteraceae bacterium]|nr:glycosyltransferase family 4 protein [Bryobacteraceae bacterium]
MRFSVDAHAIGRRLTGNEVYIRNLLRRFADLDPASSFIAYVCGEEAAPWIPAGFRRRRVSRSPYMRLGFDLSQKLREDRPDLVHVQYTAPLGCPVPVIVSVHDISFLHHPEYFPAWRAWQLQCTVRRTVRAAARVLTPSEFSRRSIVKAYNLTEESVVVVPNAVSSDFRPRSRENASREVARRWGIPSPFILTVGDLQPRKNHAGLIRAFEELIRHHPQLPHHLVMVGQETWYGSRVRRAAAESAVSGRIHMTGFLSDEDLVQFYSACEIFAFPSFYEGFGLPILEAMASGRAVACSNTTAMREVADASALLFDPRSTGEMMRALRDLAVDAELRTRMERLGHKWAASFSWDRTARKTLDVYYGVARPASSAGRLQAKSVTVS